MTTDPLTQLAEALVADGRRDREVLRRRWNAPSWRGEIERIANLLARHPLLIPAVEKLIDDELRRLGEAISPTTNSNPQTTEANPDADRQDKTVPDV